jgi:hypothetical protein
LFDARQRGLLANSSEGTNSIETRDEKVLTSPFSYEALYGRFTDGWRVSAEESMLSDCGRDVTRSVPTKLFFAKDLDSQLAERTRAACAQAGVKEGPLLDACTLDVAVIGSSKSARVYTTMPNPVAVGDTK